MLRVDDEPRRAVSSVEIVNNIIPRDMVKSLLEDPHRTKFFNPLEEGRNATDRLANLRKQWRREEATTVFTSGAFDMLHLNHAAFLLQVKLEGAPFHFARYHAGRLAPSWGALSESQQRTYCLDLLRRGDLKLIVSVDGDAAVGVRKRDKGGGPRPIFSWATRAREVLGLTTETERGSFDAVVDVVTIHDNQTPVLEDTPHRDIMPIAAFIQPDVWPVYCESQDILNALNGGSAGDFQETSVVVMSPYEYYTDGLLGGKFSTTKIATRLGGTAVSQAK